MHLMNELFTGGVITVMKKLCQILLKNKKTSLSVIALLEAILIISSVTFSWIEGSKKGALNDAGSTVAAGDGLYFTDLNGNLIDSLQLPKATLQECSSADGRNFFFPTTESVKNGNNEEKMVYRSGTYADVNSKYISQDFNVVSYSQANLYVDAKSSVVCSNESVKNSLRISINFNDNSAPILLCPGVTTGYSRPSTPVTFIDGSGNATTTSKTAYSLSEYTITGDSPITTFNGAETKRVTISVWLEGTDSDCTSDKIDASLISVNLILTTASNYTKQVTFVDYSPNRWVSNIPDTGSDSNIKMFAIDKSTIVGDDYTTGTRYELKKSDDITYTAKLPDTVEDVIFGRFDPDDSSLGYNYWGTTQSMSDSDVNKYYAIGNGISVDEANYGYWVNSNTQGVVDVELTEMSLLNVIKFTNTNTNNWDNVYAYFFDASNSPVGDTWPGIEMTFDGTNELSQNIYKVTIPDGATYVIFNNGSGGNDNQTVSIKLGDTAGYYPDGEISTDGYNNLTVSEWSTKRTLQPIFSNSTYKPNIYFASSSYGETLASIKGVFNPTTAFDSSSNYGFSMYQPDTKKKVYHMILPADSIITFNGNGKQSSSIDLSSVAAGKTKIGFKFYAADNYTTY